MLFKLYIKFLTTSTALTLFSLHYLRQRIIIIIIWAVLMTIGFFRAIAVGSIVINDTVNNRMTPQGTLKHNF